MGYLVATRWDVDVRYLLISSLIVGMIAGAGYVINDVFDAEIDKVNKPYRPIPSGKISAKRARTLALILFSIGIILSFILNFYAVFISIITSVLLYLYASHLKKSGLWGNLIVALTTALSIYYGSIAAEQGYLITLVPFAFSFMLTLGREIIKGIEDFEGDRLHGVKTLAVRFGIRTTWKISALLLILTAILGPLPAILFSYNILYLLLLIPFYFYLISSIRVPLSKEGMSRSATLLKGTALIGIISFLIGSYPFIPHL